MSILVLLGACFGSLERQRQIDSAQNLVESLRAMTLDCPAEYPSLKSAADYASCIDDSWRYLKLGRPDLVSVRLFLREGLLYQAWGVDQESQVLTPALIQRLERGNEAEFLRRQGLLSTYAALIDREQRVAWVQIDMQASAFAFFRAEMMIWASLLSLLLVVLLGSLRYADHKQIAETQRKQQSELAHYVQNLQPGAAPARKENEAQNGIPKDIEAALNELVDRLSGYSQAHVRKERERAWTTMATQIAHEINNSLTPLKLNAQYLQRLFGQSEESLSSQASRVLDHLLERLDELGAVAADFGAFAGIGLPQAEPLRMHAFLQEWLERQSSQVDAQLSLEAADAECLLTEVAIDPGHLAKLIRECLLCLDRGTEEERPSKIVVQLARSAEHLSLTLKPDTGLDTDLMMQIDELSFEHWQASTLAFASGVRVLRCYGGELQLEKSEGEARAIVLQLPPCSLQSEEYLMLKRLSA